ncbi:DedA family protein/thiosulfate sulfurtransferase GlpE [Paraburkholderia caballeronis]|uniref:Membrane protein DedA, SNARE-associated domain n=1 Tax=Paraburkholderia caballeronis TaxID=416943 RepID=A0A1H7VP82_9BURK|nr:DedA family protein/thiosulfate sulfurtransferase GlpE [Paraburkholderia caballeronis]PXW14962.1 membrane protein DedA with SNARE-associated domain [Paraburkholderia caballeronis]PXW93595.1 membrane protein DedA with SNARE-associated domain [Paraburkholderia caballeronis]RAJ88926.1 membrane protein DedA with SNARE-associated domain [Paraburkholderia caballeronis]TDV03805.1 membrane protein DedA with SNARE-associated domain [Paraburkholderia caballeronis]TDV07048.1 membrane protein DedA with
MLHDLVAQYGPALVFANVLAGSLGLPVPAMPALVLFGAMAAMHPGSIGQQVAPVLVLSIFATLIGDSVWFLAGRLYGGNTLNTLCRLSLSRDTCVKKTERFFGRWGVRVLAVAKFIPGLSIVSVPMAGAMGTPYRQFLTFDGIGAALWAGTGLAIGVLFAPQIDMLMAGASHLGRMTAVVVAVLLLLYAAWRWQRRRQLLKKLANARITVDDLHRAMQNQPPPVVFDIRSHEKRKLDPYIIPGALFADERQLDEIVSKYPPDRKLVIYCSCPNEVSAAWMAKQLAEAGFADVVPLLGGIDAWRDAGRTLEPLIAHPAAEVPVDVSPKPV